MSGVLLLWALLVPSVYGQPSEDPDVVVDQTEKPVSIEAELQGLKELLNQVKKDKDAGGDTGLHAEAAAEDHGEEDTEEEFEDIDFTGPEEELVIIEESVPLEPPVPFLPQPEG